jgi:DNA repair exonuclease SbcCD ATPase subunit
LPADIQEYIARLRSEAEEANKQKKAEAKAKQAAEEARLAEAGQFKELAAAHETRVKELEPIAQSYAKLAETINAQIDAETREWPKEVKALLASTDSAVEQRLEQMTKLRPLLEKLQAQAKGQNPGNRPNPPPAGSDNRNQNIDELRQRYQASRGNPF